MGVVRNRVPKLASDCCGFIADCGNTYDSFTRKPAYLPRSSVKGIDSWFKSGLDILVGVKEIEVLLWELIVLPLGTDPGDYFRDVSELLICGSRRE